MHACIHVTWGIYHSFMLRRFNTLCSDPGPVEGAAVVQPQAQWRGPAVVQPQAQEFNSSWGRSAPKHFTDGSKLYFWPLPAACVFFPPDLLFGPLLSFISRGCVHVNWRLLDYYCPHHQHFQCSSRTWREDLEWHNIPYLKTLLGPCPFRYPG